MTDNVGEQMTDEELHAAQPAGDFTFNLADTVVKTNYRNVTVPNWIAADGRWGDVYNALQSARDGNFATATEKVVKALEAAREYGRAEEEAKCNATGGHSDDPASVAFHGAVQQGIGRRARQQLRDQPELR